MADSTLSTQDHAVATRDGTLFARSWTPTAEGHAVANALAVGDPLPPIVLLHESLGCVALWRDFPEHLARMTGRRVVAYDRLGFGRSAAHPGVLSEDFVTQEAHGGFAAVLDALAIDRFALLGHSIGGGMGMAAAAAFPDRCTALVVESAQAFVEACTLAGIRQAKVAFAQPGQLDRLRRYHGDKAAWVLSAWVDRWLTSAFETWNLDESLRRIRCPILALHGTEDEFGSFAQSARMAALSGGAVTIERLEGCGHVPHREQQGRVLALIRAFLDDASH